MTGAANSSRVAVRALVAAAAIAACPAVARTQPGAAGAVVGVERVALQLPDGGGAPEQVLMGAVDGWLGVGPWRLSLGYAEGTVAHRSESRTITEGHAMLALRLHRGVELRAGPRAMLLTSGDAQSRWLSWQAGLRIESPLAVPGLRAVAEAWGGRSAFSSGASPALPVPHAVATGGAAGLAWRALQLEYVLESTRAGGADALVVERIRLRASVGARWSSRGTERNDSGDGRAP